jgi:single-strand DNA-binding protein
MLLGNLGNEPEIKTTKSGSEFANLSIATTDSWKDKNTGEKKEKTEWHRVVIFTQGLVKVVKNYCHKGDKLYLEGSIRTRKYDQDGQTKYSTEIVLGQYSGNIVMCSPKTSNGEAKVHGIDYPTKAQAQANRIEEELDDEIPF